MGSESAFTILGSLGTGDNVIMFSQSLASLYPTSWSNLRLAILLFFTGNSDSCSREVYLFRLRSYKLKFWIVLLLIFLSWT